MKLSKKPSRRRLAKLLTNWARRFETFERRLTRQQRKLLLTFVGRASMKWATSRLRSTVEPRSWSSLSSAASQTGNLVIGRGQHRTLLYLQLPEVRQLFSLEFVFLTAGERMDSMQHYKLVGLRATCSGRVLGHARNYSQFVKSEQVYVRGLLTDRAACCATIFGVQYDRSCYHNGVSAGTWLLRR